MIIKCPKCENNFLAPDDLNEGQDLQCGKCNHTWPLEQKIKEVPDMILPPKSRTESVKIPSDKDKGAGFKALFILVGFLIIITLGAMNFRQEIIQKVPESEKAFLLIDFFRASTEDKFDLQKLKAKEQGDRIILTGYVVNKTNFNTKTPKIKVADSFYIEAKKKMLCGGCSTIFSTSLPKTSRDKIKVSF